MESRKKPTCPKCALRWEAAGRRFYEPCLEHDPGSVEAREQQARDLRAAESAGEVADPDAQED